MATLIDELPEDWALIGCNGKKTPIDHHTGDVAARGWPSNPVDRDELKSSRHVRSVGAITGQQSGGLLVVDFDGDGAEESFQRLTGHPSTALPATIANSSGKPDRKKLFLTVNDFSIHEFITGIGSGSKEFPGLEVLWNGRQAIVIGDHPETEGYFYLDGCSPAEISKPADAPDWLISPLVFAGADDTGASLPPSADIETLQVIVSHLKPEDFTSYWPWLQMGMALKMADPSDNSKNIWLNFCQKMANFDEKEIHRKWKGFKTADEWTKKFPNKKPLSIATLVKAAKANGYRPKASPALEAAETISAEELLKDAKASPNMVNILAFLREQKACKIRWNELKRCIVINDMGSGGADMAMDPAMADVFLADQWKINAPSKRAESCLKAVALENKYNPVREYLEGLRNQELPTVTNSQLADCFGFARKDNLSISLLWLHLRACANRGMNPGEKMDSCLIVMGLQGNGKSTSIETLSPEFSWYDETTRMNFDSRDSLSSLNSAFIYEFSEIEKILTTADVAQFKSWITRKVDKYVEKYEKISMDHPRRCCLFGTTNASTFLMDPSGARRFLICENVRRANISLLKKLRDAIWKQALLEWEGGLPSYLENDSELFLEVQRRTDVATASDPWEDELSTYLSVCKAGEFVTTHQLLKHLGKAVDKLDMRDCKRIANIMKRMKWEKGRRRTINHANAVDGYIKPEPELLTEDERNSFF